MKEMYVRPVMEIVELHSDVAMLAGSNPDSNSSNVGFGGADGGVGEAESNGRRGGWGNLWE